MKSIPIELNTRAHILKTAEQYVNGDRNVSYGDPIEDFRRIASYWETHLKGTLNRTGVDEFKLEPHDVAIMMCLLKISRLNWSPEKEDSWIDLAGYSACGADCVKHEGLCDVKE